jgi:hypothetical protein
LGLVGNNGFAKNRFVSDIQIPNSSFDVVTMDNFRRGLHSYLGVGAKTSLGVCSTELRQLIQLVHFGAGSKKAMYSSSKVVRGLTIKGITICLYFATCFGD